MNPKHLLAITVLLISPYIFPQGAGNMRADTDSNRTLTPIQVAPAMVWNCEPWYDNKLVTIDLYSPLIILDDYCDDGNLWRYTSFCDHPKYGTCLFYTQENGRKGKDVSAFYKMSDVQKEIDRILLEKAKSALSGGK